ncbi:MAG: four helix bundle protein [bacterium]
MSREHLKHRTKEFAKQIIRFCRTLPNTREGRLIGVQLFRSGTSVAANYRAACRARSRREFIAKLGIVEEEADESLLWLEMIQEMEIVKSQGLEEFMKENNEILAMVVSSIKTAKSKK